MMAAELTMPDNPRAFWRAWRRALTRRSRLQQRYDYEYRVMALNEHGRPLQMRRAFRKLQEAERIYKMLDDESKRRLTETQQQGPGAFQRFVAPLYAMNARRRWVRPDDDGFYKTGRMIDGIPEVRRVP